MFGAMGTGLELLVQKCREYVSVVGAIYCCSVGKRLRCFVSRV
jgi:hypothetical protein